MINPSRPENPSRNKTRQSKRADFHDYRAPGYYHITITAYPGSPPLSSITMPKDRALRKNNMIIPDTTPLGKLVESELLTIPENCPLLRIRRYVIMPDHIHFVLHVTDTLEKVIGSYIAPFTKSCSQAYTELAHLPSFTTLFKPFDDQIIFNFNQLDRAIKYVEDNPRRYLLHRRYPDLFKRHLHLFIDGHEYAAYGNIFLLKQIYLLPIRIHRYWTKEQFDQYTKKCIYAITEGAIPISPAIHKEEKNIMRKAIEMGSSVILLRELSFNERFKPEGEYFDLCAEGRLLYLAPWPNNLTRVSAAGHAVFHKMNDFAATIATIPAESRFSIRIE